MIPDVYHVPVVDSCIYTLVMISTIITWPLEMLMLRYQLLNVDCKKFLSKTSPLADLSFTLSYNATPSSNEFSRRTLGGSWLYASNYNTYDMRFCSL